MDYYYSWAKIGIAVGLLMGFLVFLGVTSIGIYIGIPVVTSLFLGIGSSFAMFLAVAISKVISFVTGAWIRKMFKLSPKKPFWRIWQTGFLGWLLFYSISVIFKLSGFDIWTLVGAAVLGLISSFIILKFVEKIGWRIPE